MCALLVAASCSGGVSQVDEAAVTSTTGTIPDTPTATPTPTVTTTATPTPTREVPEGAGRVSLDTPEEELDVAFDHVRGFWDELTRPGDHVADPLPGRFVAPGGYFDWFFYWDSYFIVLGLVVQDEWELATDIVDNLVHEVETYGFVPNYNAPFDVCGSRSQPPYLTAAIWEVYPYVDDAGWLARAYAAAEREYEGFWTASPHVTDTGLSRFVDATGEGCITTPDTPHFRAMAESGWDNTPRFGDDVSQVVPVDLNAQLYRYETDLAVMAGILGDDDAAARWRERAEQRSELIDELLWDDDVGFYFDFDLRTGRRLEGTPRCASSYVALWAGVADDDQAARMVENLSVLEQSHGVASCEAGWDDGTQHNYPVGWAYSTWYVTYGLRLYGYDDQAARIAVAWLRLVAAKLTETGVMWERYNVVEPDEPAAGRYEIQEGFGWTNGVFAALLVRVVLGLEPDPVTGSLRWGPAFPRDWVGDTVTVSLPSYPWPGGLNSECDPMACSPTSD